MDLKTFVSEVITQIGEGILDAQEKAQGRYKVGNVLLNDKTSFHSHIDGVTQSIHAVSFDIAIEIQGKNETQKGGEIAISVVSIGLNGKKTTEKISGETSRIMFSVPVVWPEYRISDEQKK